MNYGTPDMRIGGIVMGDRVLNYNGSFLIKDFTNKLESNTTFSYKEVGKIETVKNSIKGIFVAKEESVCSDHLLINISKVDPKTKERTSVSQGKKSIKFYQFF